MLRVRVTSVFDPSIEYNFRPTPSIKAKNTTNFRIKLILGVLGIFVTGQTNK